MIWSLQNSNRTWGWMALLGLHHSPHQATCTHLILQPYWWARSLPRPLLKDAALEFSPLSPASPRLFSNVQLEKVFLTSLDCPISLLPPKCKPEYLVSSFSFQYFSWALSDQDFAQTNLLNVMLSRSPWPPCHLIQWPPVSSSVMSHTSFSGLCRCCLLYLASVSPRYLKWLTRTLFQSLIPIPSAWLSLPWLSILKQKISHFSTYSDLFLASFFLIRA